MEIRNALNQGTPADFLRVLSENPKLKEILKLQDKRMEDRELLLRAYSFIEKNYSFYETPLSTFLDKAMESLFGKTEIELDELSEKIIDAIYFQQHMFGRHIFSRSVLGGKIKLKLNSALFEVWVSETYRMSKVQKNNLLSKKIEFIEEYKSLLVDSKFLSAVSLSTSGRGAVRTRFERIKDLINKFIL